MRSAFWQFVQRTAASGRDRLWEVQRYAGKRVGPAPLTVGDLCRISVEAEARTKASLASALNGDDDWSDLAEGIREDVEAGWTDEALAAVRFKH